MKELLQFAASEAAAEDLTRASLDLATGSRWTVSEISETRKIAPVTVVGEPAGEWGKQVDAIESPFVADYDAEEYTNPGLRMLNLAEFRLISKAIDVGMSWDSRVEQSRPGVRWLEVGCGTGRIALFGTMLGAKVTALDQTEGYVRATAAKMSRLPRVLPEPRLLVTPAEQFQTDEQFDVTTVMFGVANHFENWRDGLSTISKVVAGGGVLALSMYGSPEAAVYDEISKGLPYKPAILTRRAPGGILLGESAEEILPASFPYPEQVLECLEANSLTVEDVQPFLAVTALYPREPDAESIDAYINVIENRYGSDIADMLRPYAQNPKQLLVASLYADYQIPKERINEAAYFGVIARKDK